jgi:putative ABC transport system ATP-binding protein
MSALRLTGIGYVVSRTLLEGIDLELRAGELTALSGPSGSGKTTLLSVAGGLLEATSGTATYDGRSMWRGTGDPRPEVAFVLQVYGLVPILSARENVSVALRARGVEPAEADARAQAALARFHIADLGDRQVEELSGGQMQRVALARGLCVEADILLADEPTSELDEGNRGMVLAELRAEADRGAVVVVATHDPAVAEACDRHYVLDEGRLVDHVAAVDLSHFAHPERLRVAEAAPPPLTPPPARPAGQRVAQPVAPPVAPPVAQPVAQPVAEPASVPGLGRPVDGSPHVASPRRGDAEADAAFRRPSESDGETGGSA